MVKSLSKAPIRMARMPLGVLSFTPPLLRHIILSIAWQPSLAAAVLLVLEVRSASFSLGLRSQGVKSQCSMNKPIVLRKAHNSHFNSSFNSLFNSFFNNVQWSMLNELRTLDS